MSIFAFGYGCYTDDLNPKREEEYQDDILKTFPKSVMEGYVCSWEANRHDFDGESEFLKWFVWEYGNCYGNSGTEALIARIINENEFGGREVFTGDELCLFAQPLFPQDEKNKESIPLEDDLDAALDKYLKIFYKNPERADISYHLFEELY